MRRTGAEASGEDEESVVLVFTADADFRLDCFRISFARELPKFLLKISLNYPQISAKFRANFFS